MMRGFDYLTLDPSPRLRRMRVEQQRSANDPTQVIREAWLSVGAAIRQALQLTSGKINSPELAPTLRLLDTPGLRLFLLPLNLLRTTELCQAPQRG